MLLALVLGVGIAGCDDVSSASSDAASSAAPAESQQEAGGGDSAASEEVPAEESGEEPAAEPTDDEVHGIDVLEIENAVKSLWKAGIYAESAMGCTGPVIKMPAKHVEKAKVILKENGYL